MLGFRTTLLSFSMLQEKNLLSSWHTKKSPERKPKKNMFTSIDVHMVVRVSLLWVEKPLTQHDLVLHWWWLREEWARHFGKYHKSFTSELNCIKLPPKPYYIHIISKVNQPLIFRQIGKKIVSKKATFRPQNQPHFVISFVIVYCKGKNADLMIFAKQTYKNVYHLYV